MDDGWGWNMGPSPPKSQTSPTWAKGVVPLAGSNRKLLFSIWTMDWPLTRNMTWLASLVQGRPCYGWGEHPTMRKLPSLPRSGNNMLDASPIGKKAWSLRQGAQNINLKWDTTTNVSVIVLQPWPDRTSGWDSVAWVMKVDSLHDPAGHKSCETVWSLEVSWVLSCTEF